jgi:hypothetical protein
MIFSFAIMPWKCSIIFLNGFQASTNIVFLLMIKDLLHNNYLINDYYVNKKYKIQLMVKKKIHKIHVQNYLYIYSCKSTKDLSNSFYEVKI